MQSFQPAPPQQTPPSTSPPLLPPKSSLLQKLKAHKTPAILLGVGILFLSGITGYFIVSPSQETLVSPATQDKSNTPPTAIPSFPPTIAPSLAPSTTTVPTVSSATTWKTYNSSTYGYSIKYPTDWTVTNLGALEPLVPSYIVFNPKTASSSARYITIAISNRTYAEQLALSASGSATTVGGIIGTRQSFRDSDGNTSTVVTLPRTNNLLVIRGKTVYLPIFNQMLTTLITTK